MHYRPEIDGLRAVAVGGVILYHADLSLAGIAVLPGGFIGVDIFFVISGYLITRLLLSDIAGGNFKFLNFYERRARRILPALFFVIVASLPVAWLTMMPPALKAYSGSILSAIMFGSNFWFLNEESYIAEPSALKPFLHTWSLSVEEQFYVIFPILLLMLWKFSRTNIANLFIVTFIVSLLMADIGSRTYKDLTFYLLPTRAWELMAGALLAHAESRGFQISSYSYHPLLPIFGLLAIGTSFVLFNDTMLHPSALTLIPVVGTVAIIAHNRTDQFVTQILSTSPIVCTGLISYSLYLWHMPLFAFARIQNDQLTAADKLILILCTVFLSILSYIAVERPFRNRRLIGRIPFAIFLVISISSISGMFIYLYVANGKVDRYAEFQKHVNVAYWGDDKKIRYTDYATHYGCWVWVENDNYDSADPFGSCRKQEASRTKKTILVIGDSHAAVLVPGLVNFFGRDSIAQRTASICFPSPEFSRATRNGYSDYCREEMRQAYSEIERLKPHLVIIAAAWAAGNGKQYEEFFTNQFRSLLGDYVNRTVIVGPLVRWPGKGLRAILFEQFVKDGKVPERLVPSTETFEIEKGIRVFAKQIGAGYLSPVHAFCVEEACLTKVGESPDAVTSWDRAHISIEASRYLIEQNLGLLNAYLGRGSAADTVRPGP